MFVLEPALREQSSSPVVGAGHERTPPRRRLNRRERVPVSACLTLPCNYPLTRWGRREDGMGWFMPVTRKGPWLPRRRCYQKQQ